MVTESDSALRQGANVTATILLVVRKRQENLSGFRDDLAWEIADAVGEHIKSLTGLDQSVRNISEGSGGCGNLAQVVDEVHQRGPCQPQ